MPIKHTVRQGDGFASIAQHYGFFWETLWNDPANAALKQQRKHPEFLLPGDEVVVPDKRLKEVDAATARRHRFKRRGVPARLEVQLMDGEVPRANLPYVLEIDGTPLSGTTDGEGWIRVWVDPEARRARLFLDEAREVVELDLGHIDPIDSPTGVKARLCNLGYLGDSPGGAIDEGTVNALRLFQADQSLPVTGEVDDATRAALQSAHGD